MNRDNLLKLAIYLEKLPTDYQHFDMGGYYDRYHNLTPEQQVDYALNNGGVDKLNCGTVACAVGHGPAAGLLMTPSQVYGRFPLWESYCCETFVDIDTSEFEWMFGGRWGDVDNTPHGAAKRIRYILNHADVPHEFSENGDVPTPEMVEIYS